MTAAKNRKAVVFFATAKPGRAALGAFIFIRSAMATNQFDMSKDTKKTTDTKALTNQDGADTGLQFDSGLITGVGVTKEQLRRRKKELAALAERKTDEGVLVTSAYWEANEGDTIRGIFRGWTNIFKKLTGRDLEKAREENDPTLVGDTKKILCVVIDTLGGIRLNGSMNMVELFQVGAPIGSGVEVTCTSAKSGSMKTFSVIVFTDEDDQDETAES